MDDLADKTRSSAPTIRYDEQIGLLDECPGSRADRACIRPHDVERLTFIRWCRDSDSRSIKERSTGRTVAPWWSLHAMPCELRKRSVAGRGLDSPDPEA